MFPSSLRVPLDQCRLARSARHNVSIRPTPLQGRRRNLHSDLPPISISDAIKPAAGFGGLRSSARYWLAIGMEDIKDEGE